MSGILKFLFVLFAFYLLLKSLGFLLKLWMRNKISQLQKRAGQKSGFETENTTKVETKIVKPTILKSKPKKDDYVDFEEIK